MRTTSIRRGALGAVIATALVAGGAATAAVADTYPPSFTSIWIEGPSSGDSLETVKYKFTATNAEYIEDEPIEILLDDVMFAGAWDAEGMATIDVVLPEMAGLYPMSVSTLDTAIDKSVRVGRAVTISDYRIVFKGQYRVIVKGSAATDSTVLVDLVTPKDEVRTDSAKVKKGEFSIEFRSKAKGEYVANLAVKNTKKFFGSVEVWTTFKTK